MAGEEKQAGREAARNRVDYSSSLVMVSGAPITSPEVLIESARSKVDCIPACGWWLARSGWRGVDLGWEGSGWPVMQRRLRVLA